MDLSVLRKAMREYIGFGQGYERRRHERYREDFRMIEVDGGGGNANL
jgi:hypothetical protein